MAEIWLALLLVVTLGSVDPGASAALVDDIKEDWNNFKPDPVPNEIDSCDKDTLTTCDSTQVDTGADLDIFCQEIETYSGCAKAECTQTLTADQIQALQDMEDQCKTAEFETALAVITGKCTSVCSTEAGAVDTATGLDDKCQASETYLTCVTGAGCATDTDDDVVALKTPCQDTTTTSTSTTSSTDATAKTAGTTKDPADIVNDAWETFNQNSQAITSCDAKCPSSDVDTGVGSSDLTIVCQTVRDYTGCAVANCNMSESDPLLVALTKPCPDDGDDGCSILQVSILALMLSLLLSII